MNSLSIIIPAYNEENAILSIIHRTKSAAKLIQGKLNLSFVEILVVNDGSFDKTFDLIQNQSGIKIISYKNNRGYGYAIKRGFELANGTIVGFLDADGTCDPGFFISLCEPIISNHADITLGNRLTETSKMPFIRKLGNRIYAIILQILAGRIVRDTASGIRAIRKSVLPLLYPLPDGLHFTPAMSAKALFDSDVRIKEIKMHYEERIGESKLHVVRDGIRFFKIIFLTAIAYKPQKIYNSLVIFFLFIAGLYSIKPLIYYFQNRRIEDFMYFRLSAITIFLIVSCVCFGLGLINQKLTFLRKRKPKQTEGFFEKNIGLSGIILLACGIGLNYQGVITYLLYQRVYLHWVYVLCGGSLGILGLIMIFIRIISQGIDFIKEINDYTERTIQNVTSFENENNLKVIINDAPSK